MIMSLPKTMMAVVVHGIEDYRLEEVPLPQVGPGDVLVQVRATGVCASDVKAYYGARVWGSDQIEPYIETPVTPGHEFVGEVVALGEGAEEKYGLALGDLAVSEQIVPCWQCRFCRRGQYWMCERHDIYSFKHRRAEGSWAEYMKFPAGAINHKVPSEVKPEHAALVEPLACAIHAVERGEIQLGDVVVIAGMGPIGLCMLQVARLKSPAVLIALDPQEHRFQLARELGADMVLNPAKEDVIQRVLQLTDGYGCDVYIEATGAEAGVLQGLQMIRKLGTFVEFSVHAGPVAADWSIIGDQKELNVHGAHLGPYCYPRAIQYIADGTVFADRIVTHALPLERFREAIDLAHSQTESVKVVLTP
jgi:threonine dehydrogenase-like Zn-dependent dehydrogenase